MYPANRRAPFWANADRKKDPMWGGDEEEEDEPGARPPKPNTKRAWQEKKKAANTAAASTLQRGRRTCPRTAAPTKHVAAAATV